MIGMERLRCPNPYSGRRLGGAKAFTLFIAATPVMKRAFWSRIGKALFPAEETDGKARAKRGESNHHANRQQHIPRVCAQKRIFIMATPCVSGKKPTSFCIARGITSMGSVVPENTNMGK